MPRILDRCGSFHYRPTTRDKKKRQTIFSFADNNPHLTKYAVHDAVATFKAALTSSKPGSFMMVGIAHPMMIQSYSDFLGLSDIAIDKEDEWD